jgi:hypothetical protein
MRWNGVWVLGAAIAAVGFIAALTIQAFDIVSGPSQGAMAVCIGLMASGALIACLGVYLQRRADAPVTHKPKAAWKFGAAFARAQGQRRPFGQRAEYSTLPPPPAPRRNPAAARMLIPRAGQK